MLTLTLTVLALIAACIFVWFAARRTKVIQRVSGHLSGPVEQMQEQILLTADTAVERLDGKIAQMEILLAEIDRRSTMLVQQSKQQQMQQLQLEQQQQQLAGWLQTQRQQMTKDFERNQQELTRASAAAMPVSLALPATPVSVPHSVMPVEPARAEETRLPKEPATMPGRPQKDKRTTILEMAEQGYSVTDIAQNMGVGKGEVMLLLKLRKKAAT